MKSFKVMITILAAFAAIQGGAALGKDGTATGNGGNGGTMMPNLMVYPRMPVPRWCNAVQGMLADSLQWASLASGPTDSRAYLVASITNILAAYDGGTIRMQPLTYSLLADTLRLNLVYPATSMGDQSAAIVLFHFVDLARRVNAAFDVPRYLPYFEYYVRCPAGCPGEPPYDFAPMYVDYISAARTILRELFAPALPDHADRGSVLDAMAYDRWELQSLSNLIAMIQTNITSDVFARAFECLTLQLAMVQNRLENYLNGTGTAPFDDRMMRAYVEQSLGSVLGVLEAFRYRNGVGICGPDPR
jgi:hypothetical protein